MRNKTRVVTMLRLLEHARFEVLPTPSTEAKVLEFLPPDRTVTVTASPSKGLDATFDLAERLTGHGYSVVPHVAARMVSGRTELAEICERLTGKGITQIFVPGGDADPAGDYPDAFSLLRDLADLGQPFEAVGITGYPETHPSISDDLTIQSMWDKRHYATHIVSNMTFDPKAVTTWVARLRARGVQTPVLLGMPGPVERAKLLATATRIGVGESTRFLTKHRRTFLHLAAPGGFTAERFLEQCAAGISGDDAGVVGLHVFTFGQIAETEAWRNGLLERLSEQVSR